MTELFSALVRSKQFLNVFKMNIWYMKKKEKHNYKTLTLSFDQTMQEKS